MCILHYREIDQSMLDRLEGLYAPLFPSPLTHEHPVSTESADSHYQSSTVARAPEDVVLIETVSPLSRSLHRGSSRPVFIPGWEGGGAGRHWMARPPPLAQASEPRRFTSETP